jgi:hypothetical protein
MKKNRHSLYLGLFLGVGLLALFSCTFLETLKEKEPVRENVFNHKIHVVENDMGCTDCHAGAETKARAGMPELSTCADCHDEPEKGSAVEGAIAILKARTKGEGALWQKLHKGDELLFPHKVHVTKMKGTAGKPACATCHGSVGSSTALSRSVVTKMQACMDCHEAGSAAEVKGVKGAAEVVAGKTGAQMTDCSYCHRVWRRDVAPKDHRKLWRISHGEKLRFGVAKEEKYYCAQCHEEGYCENCHQIEKPRSHTAFFRIRGHGIEAEISRERCQTCHRQDYCVRCHEDTRPRDHTASWGSAPYRHCNTCHLNTTNTRCGVCHKASVGGFASKHIIAGAPQYPRDLTHAGNCTMECHTSRHPDPGPTCKTCHK